MEKMEDYQYLGSFITRGGYRARNANTKEAFMKKQAQLSSKLDLKLKNESATSESAWNLQPLKIIF